MKIENSLKTSRVPSHPMKEIFDSRNNVMIFFKIFFSAKDSYLLKPIRHLIIGRISRMEKCYTEK
jgi:hypothetical protein